MSSLSFIGFISGASVLKLNYINSIDLTKIEQNSLMYLMLMSFVTFISSYVNALYYSNEIEYKLAQFKWKLIQPRKTMLNLKGLFK